MAKKVRKDFFYCGRGVCQQGGGGGGLGGLMMAKGEE